MEAKEVLNFGLSGMLFYMWWAQNQKENGLKSVIDKQVDLIQAMRDERVELVSLVKENTASLQKSSDVLSNQSKLMEGIQAILKRR